MGQIFISYSRKDVGTVDQIVSRLKNLGFEVWIDRENIKGGELWRVEIVEAIDNAEAFVLMLSPFSAASDNVRKEVDLAESANRKLFPVKLATVTLPPQLRYQLAGIQLIDFGKDPEGKFNELVEVLQAHQKQVAESKKAETTKQAEVVIGGVNLAKFGQKEQEKLLNYIAEITATPRANLSLANLSAGSVHAFINMPVHSAYILKTAALNQDARLLKYGIDAVRLNGDRSYIHIKTGNIGSLNIKPRPSFLKLFLLSTIALSVLIAIAAAAILIAIFIFRPAFTPTATVPISTITALPTITITPTKIETITPTATRPPTNTPTVTPTLTPDLPQILFNFVQQAPYAYWRNCEGEYCDKPAEGTRLTFNSVDSKEDGLALDAKQSFIFYDNKLLEDGASYKKFISTHPKWIPYGGIRGFYDTSSVFIQPGDRFVAKVGFIQTELPGDGVIYRLLFSPGNGNPSDPESSASYLILIDEHVHQYNKQLDDWIVSLDKISGQSGWFILEVDAGPSQNSDWAAWVNARLERP